MIGWIPLLIAAYFSSHAGAFGQEVPLDDIQADELSDIFYTDEPLPTPEKLLPVGYMLVSSERPDELVLAFTRIPVSVE